MATESLKPGRAWDATFFEWTRDLQLDKNLKTPARAKGATSSWTGCSVKAQVIPEYPGKGSPADVRGRLQGIARRTGQVMVKITPGKNHSMRNIKDHMAYLAREGEETLRDQNGREINGLEEINDLAWGWQYAGPKMPEHAEHRQAFNIVFSMPEATDERAVYAAAKATSELEFAGHQWAMVQHFDEPHVHCHVIVKAENLDGLRLNPRKADLQRWRERFAHELRERGVEAEATRRGARMQREKANKPWAVTRMQERGQDTHPAPATPNAARIEKWQTTKKKAASSYDKIITALSQSDDVGDRVLAKELQHAVGTVVQENTLQNERSKNIPDRER